MINVQQWVESKEEYNTLAKRARVEEIRLTEPNLEGELDLVEFAYESGVRVYIYPNVDDSKLTFANQLEDTIIIKLVEAQRWLDKNYPIGERNTITKLIIKNNNLTDSLTLTGFNNLTELDCYNNQLTKLDLTNCAGLTELNCSINQLTELDLSSCTDLTTLCCNYNQLTKLDLTNCAGLILVNCNNNQLTNLTIFSKLVKCHTLFLNNNPFTNHSLLPLQKLTNLTLLSIENTNLTGLEFLPAGLELFYCTGQLAKVLTGYKSESSTQYYYQAWRKEHPELIANAQEITKLKTSINKMLRETGSLDKFLERIIKLEKQNQEYYQPKVEVPPKS